VLSAHLRTSARSNTTSIARPVDPWRYPAAALADAQKALRDAREIRQAATLMYALLTGWMSASRPCPVRFGALACKDPACDRLMSVPSIGPIISSAMVAAIGSGDVFAKDRDFAAWLGRVPKQISTRDPGKTARTGSRFSDHRWLAVLRPRFYLHPPHLHYCYYWDLAAAPRCR
jgi:hypothetical protein